MKRPNDQLENISPRKNQNKRCRRKSPELPEPRSSQQKLAIIERADDLVVEYGGGNVMIKNVTAVASYNWKNSDTPDIIVPGKSSNVMWKYSFYRRDLR